MVDASEPAEQKRPQPEDPDDDAPVVAKRPRQAPAKPIKGLFLDTVNRHMLDFDFEKLCSVSLSNLNVYACLVCGRYFQGRGKASHAYFHSLHEDHHVFIHLENLRIYILPDGYEETEASLNDIKYVLKPTFTKEQIQSLDSSERYSYDLNNKPYLPGFVGLNNIKANDYVNTAIHALAHIKPLRDFFLLGDLPESSELARRFGILVRRIWNPRAFKGQVSPHEFLQEMANSSQKRFTLTKQMDPIDFIVWFLNTLHTDLGGKKSGSKSIVHNTFQGQLRIETQEIVASEDNSQAKVFDLNREIKVSHVPFMFLTLDLPPPPLFQDEIEKNIIPQVPLSMLIQKYDGVAGQEQGKTLRRFKITKLPQFLIFHIKRFTKNNWDLEKNPTIVTFPIRNVDMSECYEGDTGVETRYDLVANICHEGKPGSGSGTYKVHVYCKGKDQWFQIQDLIVEEIMPQMIFLSESYIQVWGRREPEGEDMSH
ncbi:uncharacterized protein BJ171DRAFT_611077 [Polychytrium aggregatum]|uniref:uncharacterized protein n=1 Tax=Polychytrium aggregatum TaxID=110093 RepID=UPI0022FEB6CE|nr:uncharacterized protein BJ171DRAFT_611077 [Polychytrium aggregatum]KAI9192957.1 hypothetical protein BJ171DRAFT_611077 [Polychytrium aggregatum]